MKQFNLSFFRPAFQSLRDQFRAIIHANLGGFGTPQQQLLQDPHHTFRRQRSVHFDPQRFPIEIIYHIQCLKSPAITERIAHEIQRPSVIGLSRHCQDLGGSSRQAFFGLSVQMQGQFTVHAADPLVVPAVTLVSQVIAHLATAPARLAVSQLAQFLGNLWIVLFSRLVAIGTAVQVHGSTRPAFTQAMLFDHILHQLTPFIYLESFFSMMSLSTSCSRLKLAYICFRRRFSSSNSFIRFSSLTLMPAYLAFHL